MTTFFTSDTHFFHKSARARRGFENMEAMHEVMIKAWNRVVGPGDLVYHLGDFAWNTSGDNIASVMKKLNGMILLVTGNHDNSKELTRAYGQIPGGKLHILPSLYGLKISHDNKPVHLELCHYPLLVWNRSHHGAIHLHGHSHGNCKYPDNNKRLDVGVDSVGYEPISFAGVLEYFKDNDPFTAHDHHAQVLQAKP